MNPSPPNKMQAKQPDQPPAEWDLGMLVPFPELPMTIPASDPCSQYKTKKLCQSSQKTHGMDKSKALNKQPTSAPIPFPKAHVKRTPSEVQIDQNHRQAEYDIVRMSTRIGKHSRAHDHPSTFLTRNSVQKLDKEKEEARKEEELAPRRRGSGGWELAYVSTDNSQNSKRSAKFMKAKLEGGGIGNDDEEDIFSLEL
uniref:Uncharacterized protein n=1 Tax=Skeletonema marinoi TaxID=267567 RepID=A0A7S2M044_9STRA|mmetsp:Transcript_32359/g.54640  ORF Transcript_32359/g.54640 Transcript_32359/m.54640 type:complete len:197 (+) Transcript_32359:77-667(+)